MTRVSARAALRVVLAGALLLGSAPLVVQPVIAVGPCPGSATQCISGVPATITWSAAAIQGGAEVRTEIVGPVRYNATTDYQPRIQMRTLCINVNCGGGNASIIGGGSIRIAVGPQNCGVSTATCVFSGGSAAQQPCNAFSTTLATGTGANTFVQSNPAAANVGILTSTGPTPIAVLALGGTPTPICSSQADGDVELRLARINIGVTVPAGKLSGTYTGTLVFDIS